MHPPTPSHKNKYIYNEMLFDEYYLKPLKKDKKMVKDLQAFIRADYNMDGFKKFNIKFSCFKRRERLDTSRR